MIYDCFLFFNEINILEIRLKELYNKVDKFILIESTKSFSGNDKPLYYNENKTKFKEFNNKIIHIIIDKEFPNIKNNNRWELEYFQRRYIKKILDKQKLENNDIVLFSDVDEIIYSNYIDKINDLLNEYKLVVCNLVEIKFFLNNKKRDELFGNIAIKYKNLSDTQELRSLYCGHISYDYNIKKFNNHIYKKEVFFIKSSGLHLGSLGGFLYQKYKVQNFSHIEYDNLNDNRIQKITNFYDDIHNNIEWRKNNLWFNVDNYEDLEFDKNNNLKSSILFSNIINNFNKYKHLFVLKKL